MLRDVPYYVVNIAVAPIRKEPDQRSEQVTQARLGEILKLLEVEKGWLRIKIETDGYEGYISPSMVIGYSEEEIEEWRSAGQFIFGERNADIVLSPEEGAGFVRNAGMSVRLPLIERKDGWSKVRLPDGTLGWTSAPEFNLAELGSRDGIIETAKMFSGTPYLWGGRSSAGFDCSGFIQIVFELNGIALPRDTYQQIEIGEKIGEDWGKAKVGDLVFFGNGKGRVNHIGIYLGGGRFIHSSGMVHVKSLDPEDELYGASFARRYMHVRSIESFLK